MTLYILKYNNYYNRLVKSFDTMEEYEPYVTYTLQSTNFNPSDGVDTQHVFGVGEYDGTGDYIIALDEDGQIASRWFIIDTVRTRAGQYQVQLRRDLIVDYYNIIKQSPMFIEKATLQTPSTLMYNQESISVNQIKLKQDTLKDFSGIPWLVGYMPKKYKNDNWVNVEYSADRVVDIELTQGIASWEYYKYNTGVNFSIPQRVFFGTAVNTDTTATTSSTWKTNSYKSPYPIIREDNGTYWNYQAFEGQVAYTDYKDYSLSMTSSGYQIAGFVTNGDYSPKVPYSSTVLEKLKNKFYSKGVNSRIPTKQEISDFNDLKGKIVHDAVTGLYYQVKIEKRRTALYIDYPPVDNASPSDTTFALMRDNFSPNAGIYYEVTGSPNKYSFPVYWTSIDYYIDLLDVSGSAKFKVDDTDRYETADSAFDVFAIPYTDNLSLYINVEDLPPKPICKTSKSLALAVALQATSQLGQGAIYDLQLLPYCPCRYIEKFYKKTPGWHQREDGTWSGTGDFYNVRTEYCLDVSLLNPVITGIYKKDVENPTTNDLLQVMLWATESAFTFDIPYTIDIPTDIKELKVANQCDNYRLVSPTGSGQFEFSAILNGGVSSFNVDCTYQPFNPYIHINPNFGELYGQDYNDWRGLICSGDFSLPQQTSAWADYKLQNKNYQESFDRTLQNMRVQHDAQRTAETWGVVTGTIGGAVSGATTGALAGGGIGAAVGGILGGAASLAGGFADQQMNQKLRAEAIDYTKDQFGYQLDNIKALPYGVTKSTPLTNNNPIFPILEYYSCTETEKQIVRDKLRWNGMTIMAIGTIESYYNPEEEQYIKGRLIRYMDDGENFHVVNSIAGELNKGVFI